jgi:hypothetical protein
MFSDIIFKAYCDLIEDGSSCIPDIYPPGAVINMLTHLNYVRFLSDSNNGTDVNTDVVKEDLMQQARKLAEADYAKMMKEYKEENKGMVPLSLQIFI